MKKFVLFVIAISCTLLSIGSVVPTSEPPRNASQMLVPVGKSGKTISLKELSEISLEEFENLTGKKMRFLDRLAFYKGQKKLKKQMDEEGVLTEKGYKKLAPFFGGEEGFHFGGFALGFFLGLIGVILAYVAFNDDYSKNRRKWAWSGFGVSVALMALLITIATQST